MTYQSHGFEISDALSSSQETYDLDFESWGWRYEHGGAAGLLENIRFPPPGQPAIPTTLAGLSIGPKSTIDRCWVTFDRQKNLMIPNDGTLDLTTTPPRYLSVNTPLTYAQATNVGTLLAGDSQAVAMQKGLLYVYTYGDLGLDGNPADGLRGKTTVLPATYVDQFGVTRNITSAGIDFETPFLHLVLNLRAGSALVTPPTKRFPLLRSTSTIATVAGPKTRVALIPIYGRKNVRVQLVSLVSAPLGLTPQICSFWVGLLRNLNEATPAVEVPAGSALTVPASSIATDFALTNPCADYLAIYATTTVASAFVVCTIVGED